MNFPQIRRILDMRRAQREPPLLPPTKKLSATSATDSRPVVRDFVDIGVEISNLPLSNSQVVIAVYERGIGLDSDWRLISESDVITLCGGGLRRPNLFSAEFLLERAVSYRVELLVPVDSSPPQPFPFPNDCCCCCCARTSSRSARLDVFRTDHSAAVPVAGARLSAVLAFSPLSRRAKNQSKFSGGNGMTTVFGAIRSQPPFSIHLALSDLPSSKVLPQGASVMVVVQRHHGALVHRSEAVQLRRGVERLVWRPFLLQLLLDDATTDNNEEQQAVEEEFLATVVWRDERTGRAPAELGAADDSCAIQVVTKLAGKCRLSACQLVDDRFRASVQSDDGRQVAVLQIAQCGDDRTVPSVFDRLKTGFEFRLALAVDMSTTGGWEPRFLERAVRAAHLVQTTLSPFCGVDSRIAAFGVGARLPPLFRDSHHFCLVPFHGIASQKQCPQSLSTEPYLPDSAAIESALETLRTVVKPTGAAHFAHIIYHVAKMAQRAAAAAVAAAPNTYWLLLIASAADELPDLKDIVQAVIFASRAPLSIVWAIVSDDVRATSRSSSTSAVINNNNSSSSSSNASDVRRLAAAGTRLVFQQRRVQRDQLHMASVGDTDLDDDLAARLLHPLRAHLTDWLSSPSSSSSSSPYSSSTNSQSSSDDGVVAARSQGGRFTPRSRAVSLEQQIRDTHL